LGPPPGEGSRDTCNIRAFGRKVRLWRHDSTGAYPDRRELGGRGAVSAAAPESGAQAVKTPAGPLALSDTEERFCHEYVLDLNATKRTCASTPTRSPPAPPCWRLAC